MWRSEHNLLGIRVWACKKERGRIKIMSRE